MRIEFSTVITISIRFASADQHDISSERVCRKVRHRAFKSWRSYFGFSTSDSISLLFLSVRNARLYFATACFAQLARHVTLSQSLGSPDEPPRLCLPVAEDYSFKAVLPSSIVLAAKSTRFEWIRWIVYAAPFWPINTIAKLRSVIVLPKYADFTWRILAGDHVTATRHRVALNAESKGLHVVQPVH